MPESSTTISPPPADQRRYTWEYGVFETARRPATALVEGTLRSPQPVVMVTLRGGARRHEIATDDGLRYDGPDRSGMMSFLPAGCARRLRLQDVRWQWASLTVRRDLLDDDRIMRPFVGADDAFVLGLLSEMERLHASDGSLDPLYCDAMSIALTYYIARRYWARSADTDARPLRVTSWQMRRIAEFVEANLSEPIRIADLAALADRSEGHFHRAFQKTAGETPLAFIQRRRINRAMRLLATERISIACVALEVGFASPSHFARVFRKLTGCSPGRYRMQHGSD
jgi:AraC family transcriptional regulator